MSSKDNSRPPFTLDHALEIASRYYGISGTINELPSERDRNFLIQTDAGLKFVLKISATSEVRENLEAQNQALTHLKDHAPSLSVPRVVLSQNGKDIIETIDDIGQPHFTRVFSYIEGRVLAKVNPHTPKLLHDFGETMGMLSKGLEGFDHPAAHRDFYWDLQNAPKAVAEYRSLITDETRREIVNYINSLFEDQVLPRITDLRQSVVYNDANDYNILVNNAWSDEKRSFGILDFGDMVYTATVFEIAIATAYAILGKSDPMAAALQVVAGYHKLYPLTEDEIQLLFPLICMRLAASVCISAYQSTLEPDNEYLRISEAPAWNVLMRFRAYNHRQAWYAFRSVCGLSPHPESSALVEWIESNQDQFAHILGSSWDQIPTTILDLSVGSSDYSIPSDVTDIDVFTRIVNAKLEEDQAKVGIGRYNEARMIYAGPQYSTPGISDESRTVHIAVDLFSREGTKIYAPLEGIVHSFKNNDLPYDNGPTIVLEHGIPNGLKFYTLYGHLSKESIARLEVGQHISCGQELADVGQYPENGGWPPHLHFQIILDMLDFSGDYYGVCWTSQRNLWTNLCPDPNLILGIPLNRFPPEKMTMDEIIHSRHEHMGRNLSVSYRKPLKIVRGYMQYLYDEDGRPYLDSVNNVPHVGHSHPDVVKAIQKQSKVLNTNTRYLHENLVRYAEALCSTLPDSLSVCFFVNSGSEANELALRLARAHTKRDGFIVIDGAYHGNTGSLIDLSPYKHDGPGGAGKPANVESVPTPDVYRGPFKKTELNVGANYGEDVRTAIRTIADRNHPIAAFLCEPLMSCAGQIVLPDGYLKHVYSHVRDAGGVCIADEVQIGFGRTGTHFWGFETQGVIPDIVTMGKAIGNGHPLGAVVTTSEIAESFNNGMEFFSTTGGNPVSCAAGLAVLDVIRREKLQENALTVGEYLIGEILKLKEKHLTIGDVRGIGLFIGIELVVANAENLTPARDEALYIVNRMRELGVLMSVDGTYHNVLKIKPPMVFTRNNADQLVHCLERVLSEDFPRGIY
ncbi:MAG: aminotransferase class III-fold pyridoxal phosphate-dependent enzyme [Candidatus Thorarchaeota archaeon]